MPRLLPAPILLVPLVLLAPLAAFAGTPPAPPEAGALPEASVPADCPEEAYGPADQPPITIFPALPGGGFAAVPLSGAALNGGTCTPAAPPLPRAVLHGAPGGNLLNDHGAAVLDGSGGNILNPAD